MTTHNEKSTLVDNTTQNSPNNSLHLEKLGSAAFQSQYLVRDLQGGIITGAMAIPLSAGIAMMSHYPIKVALATVVFACFIGWINAWIKPGNYIGAPGVAAGLAPVLAMGVASFGMENMAFAIFLTSFIQAIIWKYNLQKYILVAVPSYMIEGLLAGVGLKIALNFFAMTYELPKDSVSVEFWNLARIQMVMISLGGFALFLYLFSKYQAKQPAVPYFALIIAGVVIAQFFQMPMLYVEDVPLSLALPIPHFEDTFTWLHVIGFALMLAIIDVIEQVMSNAAIEKIDPLKRKCDTNNSLLAIWISNMGASFFGGMTNLDGLAKSTTNKLAGAYTKFSVLIIGLVILFFVLNTEYLEYLPKFSLAIIMIFTGWKMIAGLLHVAHQGQYALMLAVFCALAVYKLGIFEGLLLAMILHGLVNYVVFRHTGNMKTLQIIKKYFERFSSGGGVD